MDYSNKKIAILGGNGFIGAHCAQRLSERGADVTCISRRGTRPAYLNNQDWANAVHWCSGDAANLNPDSLSDYDAIVISIGSPPLPTLSKAAFDLQVFKNGTTCVKAIESAADAGISRLVLIGANIPRPLKSTKFGYYVGKQQALEAAQGFASKANNQSVVLQPSVVTGKRKLNNGWTVHLDWLMSPASVLKPTHVCHVDRLANRVTKILLEDTAEKGSFGVIENRHI